MKNIIILINPYYEPLIIEKHLKIFTEHQKVAFGKIKSKVNENTPHPEQNELENIYTTTNGEDFLQLFITDYSSMYVLKVIEIVDSVDEGLKADYYKDMEVEKWFMVEDMREVVRNDFEKTRDIILSNFTTPQFGNHTFIVYGNRYHFPLIVEQKELIDYFETDEEDFKYATAMFKTNEQLQIREELVHYSFGEKRFNQLSPNTMDNLISSELEFKANRFNNTYDFTSVILKFTKSFEHEIHQFMKTLIAILIQNDPSIGDIPFSVNGITKECASLINGKANLGTYMFLLKNEAIKSAIDKYIKDYTAKRYINSSIAYQIKFVQNLRNENVHGKQATLDEAKSLRAEMIGVGKVSILVEIVKNKNRLLEK